ncbi:helix-turn-helix transcriptional regulator [Dyella ginsengisoli]|uniref:helix-turn-helix transcriptional regulator n=1 Tax=Dyella ginsengisoli TaxID=363848 RepID=UPI00034D0AEB|nr:AlpA family phage regulatory protein [Dyella ginsengisoli]
MNNTPSQDSIPHDRIVSRSELKPHWGVRFTDVHLRRLEKAGLFPRRVRLGKGTIGWLASELDQYLARLAAARTAEGGAE